MEIRYAVSRNEYPRMTTRELRAACHVESLFRPGEINLLYWETDRAVVGAAAPDEVPLTLPTEKELASEFFCERRELGIINLGAAVVHLMGTAEETRHLMMHNEEAVLSPAWSILSGCGTRAYAFVWAMGGENQRFADMDGIAAQDLR